MATMNRFEKIRAAQDAAREDREKIGVPEERSDALQKLDAIRKQQQGNASEGRADQQPGALRKLDKAKEQSDAYKKAREQREKQEKEERQQPIRRRGRHR